MNKDEITLKKIVNSDPQIDPETWEGSIFEKLVLQSMQAQAIAFVDWIIKERWQVHNNIWVCLNHKVNEPKTTAELYTLFNTNNTNNGK